MTSSNKREPTNKQQKQTYQLIASILAANSGLQISGTRKIAPTEQPKTQVFIKLLILALNPFLNPTAARLISSTLAFNANSRCSTVQFLITKNLFPVSLLGRDWYQSSSGYIYFRKAFLSSKQAWQKSVVRQYQGKFIIDYVAVEMTSPVLANIVARLFSQTGVILSPNYFNISSFMLLYYSQFSSVQLLFFPQKTMFIRIFFSSLLLYKQDESFYQLCFQSIKLC